jgi:hypothetical protein
MWFQHKHRFCVLAHGRHVRRLGILAGVEVIVPTDVRAEQETLNGPSDRPEDWET